MIIKNLTVCHIVQYADSRKGKRLERKLWENMLSANERLIWYKKAVFHSSEAGVWWSAIRLPATPLVIAMGCHRTTNSMDRANG